MTDDKQRDLFAVPERIPFQRHSETSKAAAGEAQSMAQTLRERVYREVAAHGKTGATDDEVQVALSMNPSTQRPRRVELVMQCRVRDSGEKRKTRSGRLAVVWIAT